MPEGYLEAPLAYDAIWAIALGGYIVALPPSPATKCNMYVKVGLGLLWDEGCYAPFILSQDWSFSSLLPTPSPPLPCL